MNKTDARRRWMGVICLAVAVLMVVWGQLFLPRSLDPALQMAFWGLCFLFTVGAVLIAFLDIAVLRRRTLDENRELFEATMKDIERETRITRARQ